MSASGVAPIDRSVGGLEPGLPLVLEGSAGSGRTALCLELAAAAVARGERVAYLCAEPPALVLRQAESLGFPLEAAARGGQLALLELDPGAATAVLSHGAGPLVAALRAEVPGARLWILDPITALTREIFDAQPLQALVRELFQGLSADGAALVASADRELLAEEPAAERALRTVCGAYLKLDREPGGHRALRVSQSRSGSPPNGDLRFRIGPGGSQVVAATERAEESRRRARLLVVDEDGAARSELEGWLSERWDVVGASDGVEALSRVLAERPDLILLDLQLTRIPGRELLLSMREGGVCAPVLAISAADARSSDRVGALVLGASDVMSRPLRRFELVHRVESLLRLPVESSFALEPDARLLAPSARHSRSLPRELFDERLERAVRFGQECGIGSSVVFVEAPSEADLDDLVAAADETLRAEDAVLAVTERRAALLLVATAIGESTHAMARLAERYAARRDGRSPTLAFRAVSADQARGDASDAGWKPFWQKLEPWPPVAAA